jgi:hypothetical protein
LNGERIGKIWKKSKFNGFHISQFILLFLCISISLH